MNTRPTQNQQRGATLLVALILLVLLAILGTGTLKKARIEEQMTANAYHKGITLQASESAVESSLGDLTMLQDALKSSGTIIERNVVLDNAELTSRVSYIHVGNGPAMGWSMASGGATASNVMITSKAQLAAASAKTTTVQGIYRVNPPTGD